MQFLRGRPFSGSNRRWWAGVAEASLSAALLLAGVVILVVSLTFAALNWTPDGGLYITKSVFALQLFLSIVLIAIGTIRIARLSWHVGVSAERRGALANRANELELLNELRRQREDLPTVPRDQFSPQAGQMLPFRLIPTPRNIWGLVASAVFSVVLVAIATVLVIIVATAFGLGTTEWSAQLERRLANNQLDTFSNRPWLAAAWLIPICLVGVWSIFQFFRQLLKLTGIGQTSIEVSSYPFMPGQTYKVFLSQAGRVRLKLLDVSLVCLEEATFNQGTDIRTESTTVVEHRLFRQRGISLRPGEPFKTEFELSISSGAMHSFKSPNNRVQWKIVVTGQAKSWPRLRRNFVVSLHPPAPLETRPMKR